MKLDVRDAADLLGVSTKTIYRWVAAGKLPGYRVSRGFRFDRTELLEWSTANRLPASAPPDLGDTLPVTPFSEALTAGGIHYRVEGGSRDVVLKNVVRLMRVARKDEQDALRDALIARETITSTAIGDGIALPHLRNPVRWHLDRAEIDLCFLERPVDWHALDGEPVSVLFVVTGPTVRAILSLLAQTGFALRDKKFRRSVLEHGSREAITAAARRVTADLHLPAGRAT